MIKNGQLFELGRLVSVDLSPLEASFGNLPPDPYAEQRLRSRRYSRYTYHADGTLERLPQKDFMQPKTINNYVGDVERHYENIEEALCNNPAFLRLFAELRARTELDAGAVIEAHQIRWHCAKRIKEPAPEGMHQDGFDYVAMFMIDTFNVDGGDILLYESKDSAPCFKRRLENGEFVIVNDKKLLHNAAPLVPTANNEDGHWDVIVLTANRSS
jgi:hypothetical protein